MVGFFQVVDGCLQTNFNRPGHGGQMHGGKIRPLVELKLALLFQVGDQFSHLSGQVRQVNKAAESRQLQVLNALQRREKGCIAKKGAGGI